ncbi:MAG TPA: class I tRNA ligase family protein, partial [Candidatus Pacearchaeota archaeon]|nr:class I tRNA ligase family protein [Candidatus Pacearchaeota archaeon]HOS12460.1 class I tRNA ligase family protein [Candidatus Pacearchaeota archaeon]
LREIPALGDGDFTFEKFEKRYNSDLAGGIGNLLSRTLAMINKKNVIFNRNPETIFVDKNQEVNKKIKDNFIQFNDALSEIWELVSFCDKYIEEKKPWAIEDKDENEIVFSNIIYSLKNISQMLKPFLPHTAEKIEEQIKTLKPEPLFPRI